MDNQPTIFVPKDRIITEDMLGKSTLVGTFHCRVKRDGEYIDEWKSHNLVPDVMEDHYLDVTLNGATQSTTWSIGLTGSTPTTAETDTMSSHAGWTENQDYSEASRQTWSSGAVSSQSIDNSGTPASFSINTGTTVGGAFLVDDATKGGTSGTLGAVSAFGGGDRSLQDGDTLEITYTMQMAGS